MQTNRKERQSNLELLRILTMLMILASHYAAHGIQKAAIPEIAYQEWAAGSLVNRLLTCFFNPGGEVGVAALLMITGYFQINKDRISLKKIVLECFYYSLFSLILCVGVFVSGGSFPYMGLQNVLTNVIRAVFIPVTSTYWWFVALYVFLMLLSPVINRFLRTLNRRGFLWFLALSWFLWYGVANVIGTQFFDLQKAILFYSLGAFLQLYGVNRPERRGTYALTGLIGWLIASVCFYFIGLYQLKEMSLRDELLLRFFSSLETVILVPLIAYCAFRLFESLKVGSNKLINTVSATTFGIYLLHDSLFGRPFIWYMLLDVVNRQYTQALYPVYAVLTILGLFAACSLIDMLRLLLIEPWAFKLADKAMAGAGEAFLKKDEQ